MPSQVGGATPPETGPESTRSSPRQGPIVVAPRLLMAIGAAGCRPATSASHGTRSRLNPSGSVAPTEVSGSSNGTSQALRLAALWIVAVHGHNANDGLTPSVGLCAFQQAANLAGRGTVVHILPGVYRKGARPVACGTAGGRILYPAEGGPSPIPGVALGSSTTTAGEVATLTIAVGYGELLIPPMTEYTVPITATSGDLTEATSVSLPVGVDGRTCW